MEKICSKCKELKDVSEFYRDSSRKDGFSYVCKNCKTVYFTNNKGQRRKYSNEYKLTNSSKISDRGKKYYLKNKEIINKRQKEYRLLNKEKLRYKQKELRLKSNKSLIREKKYYLENKEVISIKNKYRSKSLANYNSYFDKLTIDESPRLHSDGIYLEVKCKYCGKYFTPSIGCVKHRISSLLGNGVGDSSLYCSDGCKESCPIYRKIKHPRGFKKASSREVNPSLRQMCFERDNWKCQICEKSVEEIILHCHHIEGYTQNPLLGNDIDNVITLCKEHHKEVHKLPGCNYNQLKCNMEEICLPEV